MVVYGGNHQKVQCVRSAGAGRYASPSRGGSYGVFHRDVERVTIRGFVQPIRFGEFKGYVVHISCKTHRQWETYFLCTSELVGHRKGA